MPKSSKPSSSSMWTEQQEPVLTSEQTTSTTLVTALDIPSGSGYLQSLSCSMGGGAVDKTVLLNLKITKDSLVYFEDDVLLGSQTSVQSLFQNLRFESNMKIEFKTNSINYPANILIVHSLDK